MSNQRQPESTVPSPTTPLATRASASLRLALLRQTVEQILAWCFERQRSAGELRLCLDLLHRRGGHRAVLAASLVSFELAQRGDRTDQRQFEIMIEMARAIPDVVALADRLRRAVSQPGERWKEWRRALRSQDPRLGIEQALRAGTELVALDLFDPRDLLELGDVVPPGVDRQRMEARYRELVVAFFESQPERRSPMGERGFFARNRSDLARVEQFRDELESLHRFVPAAHALLALCELFLASHLRVRTLWGRPNAHRAQLLGHGLARLADSGRELFQVAHFFTEADSDPSAWGKLTQLVTDYLGWCASKRVPPSPRAAHRYAAEARELPALSTDDRRAVAR